MSSEYTIVVGIDFGTTYSGFAFSYNQAKYKGQQGIHVRGTQTPTCILLHPDQRLHSFGYDAQDAFVNLDEGEDSKYYYFDHFKMELHKKETIDDYTKLRTYDNREVNAMKVFKYAIKYLAKEALDDINTSSGRQFKNEHIQWVLTVPAIWSPTSKHFMRKACCGAGIISTENRGQLIIALEPEAASLYCRQRSMTHPSFLRDSSESGATIAEPGTKYIVVDIGGGTVDIVVHQINSNKAIDEIYRPTGGGWGGMLVEKEFEKVLKKQYGTSYIDDYKKKNPRDWFEIRNEFESKKKYAKCTSENYVTRIRLPDTFRDAEVVTPSYWHSSQPYAETDVQIKREYLCLSSKIMRSLFENSIDQITDHLDRVFRDHRLYGVNNMFLVGGFSQNTMLQSRLNEKYASRCRVMVPEDAALCIVKGAVMFGTNPGAIQSRTSRLTFGTDIHPKFDENKHDARYKYNSRGVDRCELFDTLVMRDETVKNGEERSFSFVPCTSDQTAAEFKFLTSTNQIVKYVGELEVREDISCILPSPNISKGVDRVFKLYIKFGDTELKATAFDVESKETKEVTLDFPKH